MNKKEFGFIGVGQAGANIVCEFENIGYSAFYINTSKEDLATLKDAKHTYHLKGGEGANKNRDKAKTILASNIEDVISEVKNKLPEPIIFVAFASSGGTGSGIAPLLIDILQQELDKTICAITVLPSETESIKSHINSYECCKELADIEVMGSTLFIDNNRNKDKFILNKIFVGLLDSFLSNNSVSTKGNLDRAEIKEIICTKGMALISKLGRDKSQTPKLIETFHNNIFAPMESDRAIKYIGLINSTTDISTDSLCKEIGTPLDIFQGYDSPVTICMLSGLSYPFTRLIEIRDKVKANQETITKSLQAVTQNKLDDDINFLDGLAVKKVIPETKKLNSRDALMKFMKK
jgi:cell division GTPase FtsZ